MSRSAQQMTHYQLSRQLEKASEQVFDACVQLAGFTETTELWTELETTERETIAALAERHRSVKNILAVIKPQARKLQTEQDLYTDAWEAHQHSLASEPRIHPVTEDDRIAAALAVRFFDTDGPEDLRELCDTLDDLGLMPDGPDWVQWGLEVRYDLLHWCPILPSEPQTTPAPPQPIEPVGDAEASDPPPEPTAAAPAAAATAAEKESA